MLTADEILAMIGTHSHAAIDDLIQYGLISRVGENYSVPSVSTLEMAAQLVAAGVEAEVAALAWGTMQLHTAALADALVAIFVDRSDYGFTGPPTAEAVARRRPRAAGGGAARRPAGLRPRDRALPGRVRGRDHGRRRSPLTAPYPRLLEPGRIGPMSTRNRLVLSPMGDRLAHDDGTVSERQATYLEARARGGVGLVMVGSVAVSYPAGAYASCQTALSDDGFIPALRDLADRVHRHGARLGAQLVHDGANSLLDIAEGRPLLVPSIPPRLRPDARSAMVTATELEAMIRPFTTPTSKMAYRVADEHDIEHVIESFVAAAARAREAGFDAVEIHAGHGYLIDSFLSPALNQRDDAWGGDVTGRARLLTEVLAAVRRRVGDDLAVWCRLNALERYRDGGETPADLVEVADLAAGAGSQAIHVSAATDAGAALGVTEAHTPHEPALLLPYAAMVKARVAVPVITVGRLEPDVAERALADGSADFVAMGRKLLADPELPNKLARGQAAAVRPCIYQYRCIGNIFLNEPVACVANPATGHGDEDRLAPADHPRRVLVVGGGPGGLEVAALLDERGHQVVLAEAAAELGGTLALAACTDDTLAQFLTWQLGRIAASGVELLLSTPVTVALVAGLEVDEVVVASGGRWTVPDVPGGASARTPAELSTWLQADHDSVGAEVAVLGGGKAGLSLAALAARRGRRVVVLEGTDVLAPELGPPGRFRLVHDVEQLGVTLVTGAVIDEITPASVRWHGADGEVIAPATTVIATGRTGELAVAESLASSGRPVHVVGDAAAVGGVAPAGLEGALADARATALAIGSD